MYAITGIAGKVGGIVARTLLAAGLPVRAVVRDADKGRPWADKAARSQSRQSPTSTVFWRRRGVSHDATRLRPRARFSENARSNRSAAQPAKVVFLSTVGAHVAQFNLLNNSKITEEGLRTVPVPVAFLRAAWFMENASWDVESAKAGIVPSFLQPLNHPIPMVATADI